MTKTIRPSAELTRELLLAGLPVSDRRLDVHGVSTAVLEGGQGPPVVLLQAEFAAVWMRVIPDLATTHHVIAPDLPGLGASQMHTGSTDIGDLVAWLGDLITRTCATPPLLVGKGPAGALAARFAIAHPGTIDRLVLVDSHGLGPYRPPIGMMLSYTGVMLRPTVKRLDRSFRRYCFADRDHIADSLGQQYELLISYAADRFSSPTVRAAMRRLLPVLSARIPAEDLSRISLPVTLIWGRQDVGVPLRVAESASARFGWPLHVIDDARDDPALERPDAFLAALRVAIAA